MARDLDRASSEDLDNASAVITGAPFTLACWVNSDNDADNQNVICITDTASNSHYIGISCEGSVGGDPLRGFISDAGGSENADTTSGFSTGTWHHACFVGAAADDRSMFIDGGSKGTNAVSRTPAGIDKSVIGSWEGSAGKFDYMDGRVAEVGVWNAALSDAEVAVLAAGFSPLFVKPENLVAYWPLIRDTDDDVVGGYNLTANNTPSIAAHPPMIYPAPPLLRYVGAYQPMQLRGIMVPHLRQWQPGAFR